MASLSSPLLVSATVNSNPCKSCTLFPSSSSRWLQSSSTRQLVCRRASESSTSSPSSSEPAPEVYNGVYGPWSIDSNDIREVFLYRAGLVTSAATFVAVASTAFLPDDNPLKSVITSYQNVLFAAGAGGLGVSLLNIHIYVTPLKKLLHLFWAIGVFACAVISREYGAGDKVVEYVLEHPEFLWGVGPLFAALTGLVFKEGLCYGKLEAALLFFNIPALLLGRLSGVMSEDVERGLLLTWMVLFVVFAGRKFTQPVKDDLGDKSIFMFNALSDSEKDDFLQARQNQEMNKQ